VHADTHSRTQVIQLNVPRILHVHEQLCARHQGQIVRSLSIVLTAYHEAAGEQRAAGHVKVSQDRRPRRNPVEPDVSPRAFHAPYGDFVEEYVSASEVLHFEGGDGSGGVDPDVFFGELDLLGFGAGHGDVGGVVGDDCC